MNQMIKQAAPPQSDAIALAAMFGAASATFGGWLGCKAYGLAAFLSLPLQFSAIPPMTALETAWHILTTGQTPPNWFYWPGIGALSSGIIGTFTGLSLFWRSGERLLRGPELVPARKLPRARGTPGLWLSPRIRLSQEEETWNILTLGSAGSGKTTILRPLAEAAIKRGDRLLIFDFKRDFTQSLVGKPGVALLAPWDSRSARWRIGEDVTSIPAARQFVSSLIPVSEKEPIWGRGARAILGAIVQALMAEFPGDWGAGDLVATTSAMLQDHQALRGALAEYGPEGLSVIDTAPATRASVLMNVGAILPQFSDIAAAENLLPAKRIWSVKRWLKTPNSVAILGWLPAAKEFSRDYAIPIIEQCIVGLLNLPDCGATDPDRRTWLVLDEIAQAGFVPSLTTGITTLRSKGGRLALGLQSIGQLRTHYGPDAAETWIGQTTTQIIGRLQNGVDSERAGASIGDRDVERYTSRSSQTGEVWQRFNEQIATVHDLRMLGPKSSGVEAMIIARGKVAIETWSYLPRNQHEEPALVESEFIRPHFRKPMARNLGRIVDLERLRRLAPPVPSWSSSDSVQ